LHTLLPIYYSDEVKLTSDFLKETNSNIEILSDQNVDENETGDTR